MNIVVVGLGSMGKRRIRLIHDLYPDYKIAGVDGREDRRQEAKDLLGIDTYDSIGAITDKIDCAFVCTSPMSHAAVISECLKRGWNVFTELNLVDDGYEENLKLASDAGLTLFISSTFYYREEIKYIRSEVDGGNWNYIYHIGQYLPDWHPWESYKDFFVGDKRTNGCREIMAIELPWLTGTFGEVKDYKVVSDRMTGLNIDYDDNFMIQFTHDNGNKGVLVVDVVSPVAVRKLEAYKEGSYVSWSGTPDSLMKFDPEQKKLMPVTLHEKTEHNDNYSAFIVENAYKNEITEFFDVVSGKKEPEYDFVKDMKILKLIDSLRA